MHLSSLPKATLQAIPDGNEGVKLTLLAMRNFVRAFKSNIAIRTKAAELTRRLPQKSWMAEVAAIHSFVKNNIRYTKDIRGVETVQDPLFTLQNGYGDCDDKSTLAAALLEAIGHPTRFVACGFSGNKLSHVFTQTRIGNNWVSVETTEPVRLGWTPPNIRNRMIVNN